MNYVMLCLKLVRTWLTASDAGVATMYSIQILPAKNDRGHMKKTKRKKKKK